MPTNSAHRSISTPDETRKWVPDWTPAKVRCTLLIQRSAFYGQDVCQRWFRSRRSPSFVILFPRAPFAVVLGAFTAAMQLVPYG